MLGHCQTTYLMFSSHVQAHLHPPCFQGRPAWAREQFLNRGSSCCACVASWPSCSSSQDNCSARRRHTGSGIKNMPRSEANAWGRVPKANLMRNGRGQKHEQRQEARNALNSQTGLQQDRKGFVHNLGFFRHLGFESGVAYVYDCIERGCPETFCSCEFMRVIENISFANCPAFFETKGPKVQSPAPPPPAPPPLFPSPRGPRH